MNRWMPGPLSVVLVLSAALLGAACDEKKPSSDSPRPDASAGIDKYATADPKLERALQAAASASAGADSSPPPDGVFAAGAANRRHPQGAATTFDVVADGSEPRVALGPAVDASLDAARASLYGPAVLELAMQLGPRTAMPTTDLRLALGPPKKDEGGSDWLVVDVKRALPAKQQLGQLPPGTDKEIATLEGTQIRVQVTPDGRESDVRMLLGKASRSELARLAQSASEALVLVTVPLPQRPVGVGAQWIAETRMPLMGLDAIAYRAYRVKSIEGERVHVTVDVKAYAASAETDLPGVPSGSKVAQFGAEGHGEMDLARGESVARKADIQERVVMVFEAPGAPQAQTQPGQPQGNMLSAQFQSQATFVRGEDLRAAIKP
jgi:hypothetical protein